MSEFFIIDNEQVHANDCYIVAGDKNLMNSTQLNADKIKTGGAYGDYLLVTMFDNNITDFLNAGNDPEADKVGITSCVDLLPFKTKADAKAWVDQWHIDNPSDEV